MDFANVKDWYIPDGGTNRDVWKVTDASGRTLWRKKFFIKYNSNDGAVDTYVVSFNGNGATYGSVASIAGRGGSQYTMPANGFQRTGYTFSGTWNTSPSGAGQAYTPGAQYTYQSDMQLYAQWTANSYSITFYGNGATSGAMSPVSSGSGIGVVLPPCAFKRTGYTFSEWCEKQDGSGQHYADEDYLVMPAGDVVLYAQWVINAYTLTLTKGTGIAKIYYKVNGAGSYTETSSSKNVPVTYNTTWYAYAVPADGYTYTATSEAKPASGTMGVSGAKFEPSATANTYTVTFDPKGGSVSPTTKNVTYDSPYGDLPVPTCSGKNFSGWYMEAGTILVSSSTTVKTAGNHKLYAHWTDITYTVMLHASPSSGGTVSGGGTYTSGQTATVSASPSAGYAFKSWSDGGAQTHNITVTSNTNLTAYFELVSTDSLLITNAADNVWTSSGNYIKVVE